MGDKLLEIQNQIRNNANNIRDYIDDLSNWEAEMNQLDASLSNKTYPLSEPPPIRSSVETKEDSKKAEENPVLKRDKAKMKDYYKAWDQFDVDAEIEKLEDAPPTMKAPKKPAPVQSKIIVKGGRSVNSEIDRLKDQGNLHFTSKEFEKALEKYQECLMKGNVPVDVQVILHSNSAECFLRLKKAKDALEQAQKALDLDNKHIKSLLRRAKAKKIMGKYKSANIDLEACLEIEPKNAAVLTEKSKLEKKKASLIEEAKSKMINKSRPSPPDLVKIEVVEINSKNPEENKEKTEKKPEKDLKEQTSKAIESISIEKLPPPKNIVEFERTWAMLGDVKKLKSYLESISNDQIEALFSKGNIESDFFMRIINTFLTNFTDFQEIIAIYLQAIMKCKKISIITKFLTKKEKSSIRDLLNLIGNPSGFEVFTN